MRLRTLRIHWFGYSVTPLRHLRPKGKRAHSHTHPNEHFLGNRDSMFPLRCERIPQTPTTSLLLLSQIVLHNLICCEYTVPLSLPYLCKQRCALLYLLLGWVLPVAAIDGQVEIVTMKWRHRCLLSSRPGGSGLAWPWPFLSPFYSFPCILHF